MYQKELHFDAISFKGNTQNISNRGMCIIKPVETMGCTKENIRLLFDEAKKDFPELRFLDVTLQGYEEEYTRVALREAYIGDMDLNATLEKMQLNGIVFQQPKITPVPLTYCKQQSVLGAQG
jgi:hypothetical protein